jgi:allophanate hydrolase subunit 2
VSGWPALEVAPVPPPAAGTVVLRALPGPWPDAWGPAALAALFATPWSASADSDRVGLRLQGDPVLDERPAATVTRWPSAGLVRGAIQVPPGGRPLIFLADHPVTGGYPVLACLLEAVRLRAVGGERGS